MHFFNAGVRLCRTESGLICGLRALPLGKGAILRKYAQKEECASCATLEVRAAQRPRSFLTPPDYSFIHDGVPGSTAAKYLEATSAFTRL